ncbi:hypothetical protein SISSUDRAFT_1039364, partial [Sistotremastrum suecicum HHB10207 ss-3]
MPLDLPNVSQTTQIRTDDYATIGGVLGSVLCSAVFWRRARIVHCERYAIVSGV